MTKGKLIYIPVAAIMALFITERTAHLVAAKNAQLLAGEGLAPAQYRLLFPVLFTPLANAIGNAAAVWLFWVVALALFAFLLHLWLERLHMADRAQSTTLLTLWVVLGFTWFYAGGAHLSMIEALSWLVALLLLADGRVWSLVPLVAVATLNRETAIFLVILAAVLSRQWGPVLVMVAVWAVFYGVIRLYVGQLPMVYSVSEIFHHNLFSYRLGHFLLGLVLFGWIPALAVRGYRKAPPMLRRSAWVAALYLGAIAIFGLWREFRLFLPLLPVAIPLVMGAKEETGDHP